MLQLLSEIYEIVELALWSGRVQGEKTVSLLLCSTPETGKTTLLQGFDHVDGVYWASDVTAWGIAKHLRVPLSNGNIRCLIIPDLLQSLAHKNETVEGLVGMLNGLIEEGQATILTYAYHVTLKAPKPIGVITAIPMGELLLRRSKWQSMGFTSRLLPVSWGYSEVALDLIYRRITEQAAALAQIEVHLPLEDVPVAMDSALAMRLEPTSRQLGRAEGVYGFRYQKHFQRLTKAAALRRSGGNPCEVTAEDVDRVLELSRFCNLDQRKV